MAHTEGLQGWSMTTPSPHPGHLSSHSYPFCQLPGLIGPHPIGYKHNGFQVSQVSLAVLCSLRRCRMAQIKQGPEWKSAGECPCEQRLGALQRAVSCAQSSSAGLCVQHSPTPKGPGTQPPKQEGSFIPTTFSPGPSHQPRNIGYLWVSCTILSVFAPRDSMSPWSSGNTIPLPPLEH